MTVYLLHIDPGLRHSKHYIGYAESHNLNERIKRHLNGTGGVLPREAIKRGCVITVAHVWVDGTKEFERYVKKYGGAVRYCPICNLNKRKIPTIEAFNRSKTQCDAIQP